MLNEALIYLLAAVVSVPIAKRLGLGSVLGYLLAGVLIGPFVFGLVGEQTDVMHFAEFGVVMMLFLIGLELQPSRLWALRRSILGLGGLQVMLTALIVAISLHLITDFAWQTSVAIGLAVALSSTAIVMQTLNEKNWNKSQAGTNAFSVLLFQDIAVIPILALLPFLALSHGGSDGGHHTSLISEFPTWLQILTSFAVIATIILGGKFLSAPMFRYIAHSRIREIFTATALLIVVAIAALMQSIGLSAALGTFLAGVVLADNEFRHELEVDISPFKGLLLGLFFITVGASINFALVIAEPLVILSAVFALILIKMAVLGLLAKLFKLSTGAGLLFAVALAQGGEFAFVITASAAPYGIFPTTVGDTLIVVVALSMLASPIMFVIYEFYMTRKNRKSDSQLDQKQYDDVTNQGQVIIAGYGRFGQVIGRLLDAQGYDLTIFDHSPSRVEMVRRFGNTVYYGDASRGDMLHAAGASNAKLLIVAVDEPDLTLDIIEVAKRHFPHLKILARAIDRRHAYELMRTDIDGFKRETFDSALNMGVDALKLLGISDDDANRAGTMFYDHDHKGLEILFEKWGDDRSYGIAVKQRMEDLRSVLQADQEEKKV